MWARKTHTHALEPVKATWDAEGPADEGRGSDLLKVPKQVRPEDEKEEVR